ncbi:hypothetical protein C8F01DRAFT_1164484 [Mycena amicta]|nr:hypothetical protein C8F01DRAFT_1164484 [Mycena amicta]
MERKGVALVTGAGQGIGQAIALRLAADGFDVCVNDIASNSGNLNAVVEGIRKTGRASSAHIADVSIETEVKTMVDEVVAAHGSLNVMVANAGICPWATLAEKEWDRLMAVNLRGTFLCYKVAAAQMIAQGIGGRIIGACSSSGKRAANPFMGAYCASKFAVRGLTQAAALEFGPHKITVNAYAPGPVDTDMRTSFGVWSLFGAEFPSVKFLDSSNEAISGSALSEHMKSTIPLGRIGTTDDVANLVSFLASDQSGYITGERLRASSFFFFAEESSHLGQSVSPIV